MEGVAFGLRDSTEIIGEAAPLDEVRASGGGASSKLWLQIIADVVDLPVSVVGTPEAAAHGAALLAATGNGAFSSIAEATDAAVKVGDPVEPTSVTGVYDEAYGIYRDLYPALKDVYPRLAHLDG